MVITLAKSPIEVGQPRGPGLGHGAASIARAGEAGQWLQAHGQNSPITRHALYVLESMDAIDPAFDTFVCALLDGDLDNAGYPEYSAIVGGVAAHWDESTGDLIVRGFVSLVGRGTRGDTDRTANRILATILANILESSGSLGVTALDRPVLGTGSSGATRGHCAFTVAHGRAVFCPKCGMRLLRG